MLSILRISFPWACDKDQLEGYSINKGSCSSAFTVVVCKSGDQEDFSFAKPHLFSTRIVDNGLIEPN